MRIMVLSAAQYASGGFKHLTFSGSKNKLAARG